MITRNEVVNLYRLILDRQPESDEVINEKRRAASVSEAAFEMLISTEFVSNNGAMIARIISRKD